MRDILPVPLLPPALFAPDVFRRRGRCPSDTLERRPEGRVAVAVAAAAVPLASFGSCVPGFAAKTRLLTLSHLLFSVNGNESRREVSGSGKVVSTVDI